MPSKIIDMNDFTANNCNVKVEIARHIHKLKTGKVKGLTDTYFCKEIEDPASGYTELLAQEFFRLIIDHQPKTYLAKDSALNIFYILSQQVLNFHLLPLDHQSDFTEGRHPGLGQILITAFFLGEKDLKNGNIGTDFLDRTVKLDGGWCFAKLMGECEDKSEKFTKKTIEELPYLDAWSYHWLDIYRNGKKYRKSHIVNRDLSKSPFFREEINQAMYRILLLTDDFLQKFVDAYIPCGFNADRYVEYLKERRNELRAVAIFSPSFQEYMRSYAFIEQIFCRLRFGSFSADEANPILDEKQQKELPAEISLQHQYLLGLCEFAASMDKQKDQFNLDALETYKAEVDRYRKLVENDAQLAVIAIPFIERAEVSLRQKMKKLAFLSSCQFEEYLNYFRKYTSPKLKKITTTFDKARLSFLADDKSFDAALHRFKIACKKGLDINSIDQKCKSKVKQFLELVANDGVPTCKQLGFFRTSGAKKILAKKKEYVNEGTKRATPC